MPRSLITTNSIKRVFGDFGLYIIFRAELENRPEKDIDRDIQTDRQTDNALERVDRANCAMCGPWTLILLVNFAGYGPAYIKCT